MTSSVSLSLFTIASAIGWIWIPSVVLLSRQRSIAAVPIAALAASSDASGLRKIVPPSAVISPHSLLHGERKERELFAEIPQYCSSRDGWLHHYSLLVRRVIRVAQTIVFVPPASYWLFARFC